MTASPPTIMASPNARRVTMLITPQLAQQWLERNTRNRPLSEKPLSSPTALTCWRADGSTTALRSASIPAGSLIDGQHRLKACIESGVSFENDVIFDLPPEAMRTIDIHRPRTAGHIAHIEGAQNASCACAVASLIVLHRRHGIQQLNDPRCQPTEDADRRGGTESVRTRWGGGTGEASGKETRAAASGGLLLLPVRGAESRLGRQVLRASWRSRAESMPDNPVYHLRERLLTDRQARERSCPSLTSWRCSSRRGCSTARSAPCGSCSGRRTVLAREVSGNRRGSMTAPVVSTYSMWSLFRNCRKAVDWRYIQQLVGLERDGNLHFGTLVHQCLELWHAVPRPRRACWISSALSARTGCMTMASAGTGTTPRL